MIVTMRRMVKILCLLSIFLLFSPGNDLFPEIIVKYDKNGNKIITNTPSPNTLFKKPKKVKKGPAALSESIPQRYLVKIKTLAQKYKLQEKLIIAVAKAESNFDPAAVSKKGAVGIMQLMKATAKDYGVKNRFDPDQNLEAGVKHLKYLYTRYNSDLPLTLAAYNAGEEAVKKHKGIPPYKETKTYIKRVMKYMGLHYTGVFGSRRSTKIFKIITKEGRVIITDMLPAKFDGVVTVIE
ncbi:MAG: lytic transglycosylase domain-containing protein [Candidatus Aminicenantes bacterium]|nr:lytic transglycosylase domain-containing protein [Candidatus Aminicenantes bacterium]